MAGPVGRTFSAETDVAMKAEILSWSRARGVFGGYRWKVRRCEQASLRQGTQCEGNREGWQGQNTGGRDAIDPPPTGHLSETRGLRHWRCKLRRGEEARFID